MDLKALRATVKRLLDEDGVRRSDAMLDDSINEGYHMVSLLTQGCELTASFYMDGSMYFRYIPRDAVVPISVSFDGTRLFPTRLSDWDGLSTTWMSDAASEPVYYACNNLLSSWPELWVYPRPETTGTLRLVYAAVPTKLVMEADIPRLPAEHHYCVIWWAYMWELLKERGAFFVNKAFQTVQKFIQETNALRQYVYLRTPDRDWLMPPLDAETITKKLHAMVGAAAPPEPGQESRDLSL